MSCNGLNTDTIYFGGITPPYTTKTEFWNGTSWTEVNDLSTAKGYAAGTGTSTSAFSFGGEPGSLSTTEEWTTTPAPSFQQENLGQVFYNSTSNAFKVTKDNSGAPIGTWSSGSSLNTARGPAGAAGSGTLTSGLCISISVPVTNVEEYDGSTWTEIADVNAGRYDGAGVGATAPASLFIAGYTPLGVVANTESYNGTIWTEVNDVNTARYNASSFGTQTSAILGGGYVTAVNSAIESWNGTSWTEIAELNNLRADSARTGVSNTSGLFAGGYTPASPTETVNTEIWNGTSWTEVNNLNTARAGLGGSGTATSALVFGGFTPPDVAVHRSLGWYFLD
jgi:hypothetical protein